MKKHVILVLVMAVFVAEFTSICFAIPASFQGLGYLLPDDTYSRASDISADGSTVVGSSYGNPYRWTAESGMVDLGYLPQPPDGSRHTGSANAVSADGSVVVGSSGEAFRWTESEGMVGLGYLPGVTNDSRAFGVSADGSVIVGWGNSASGYYEAFRWTESSGMVGLGGLPGVRLQMSRAEDVSADGLVVVGNVYGGNYYEPFRWTESEGIVSLGGLPGWNLEGSANTVSADGSVVAGACLSGSGLEAFRWTESGGMVGLGDLPGGEFRSDAYAISADGSVVVGRSVTEGMFKIDHFVKLEAFIWDSDNGIRNLKDVLVNDYGLNLTGWTLDEARGISADGMTIVGYGRNPEDQTEAWIATIPEPATIMLFGFGGLALLKNRKV